MFIVKLETDNARISLNTGRNASGFFTTRFIRANDEFSAAGLARESVIAELDEKAGRGRYELGTLIVTSTREISAEHNASSVNAGFTFIDSDLTPVELFIERVRRLLGRPRIFEVEIKPPPGTTD